MSAHVIGTLVGKDLNLYFRNRFFAFITILGLVIYIALYFFLPNTVDETLDLAVYAPDVPRDVLTEMEEDGLALIDMPSEEALITAVSAGDYDIGIVMPANLRREIARGDLPPMRLYLTPDVPPEFRDVYLIMARELAFLVSGDPLYLDVTEEVVGMDMAGQQIPPRDRMLPMLAVLILMMETLGLASLISSEVEAGTIRALLITPMSIADLFVGKGVTGVALAFIQVLLLMAITGGLRQAPLLILTTLFLGSILVTGIGFLLASAARDMMSVLGWGILVVLLLALPALVVFLPGITTDWIRLIPTHYLVDTIYRVLNFDAGWADVWPNLVAIALFAALFVGLGVWALRRRFT